MDLNGFVGTIVIPSCSPTEILFGSFYFITIVNNILIMGHAKLHLQSSKLEGDPTKWPHMLVIFALI